MTHPMSQIQYQPQPPLPKRSKFGALAWTAVILGIVGLVGSPIIILNNLTAVVAGVGLVLGVIALFGTRKVLAVIGVVLCVAGIAATVNFQRKAVDELDKIVSGSTNQGQVSDGGASAEPTQPATAETPTWGKRYTWKDGLAIDVSAPTGCRPGQFAVPQNAARTAKFTVTITNGTDKPFETAGFSFGSDAQFNGQKAERVFDTSGECGTGGVEASTVLPGKTYTYAVAYAVGAQPGEMQLVFQPNFGADKAVYVGQA